MKRSDIFLGFALLFVTIAVASNLSMPATMRDPAARHPDTSKIHPARLSDCAICVTNHSK